MRGLQRQLIILSFSLTCLYSNAAIPPQQLVLEVQKVNVVSQTKSEINMAMMIPTNLQPGQSEEEITVRVVDRSVSSFAQGDYFRNSEIGKAASNFEKSLKTDVNLGGSPEKGEISHSVNMQVQAFEQKAYIHYTGLADLQVTYLANNSNINMELTEKLGGSTQLVFTHNIQDQLSRANLSWNW